MASGIEINGTVTSDSSAPFTRSQLETIRQQVDYYVGDRFPGNPLGQKVKSETNVCLVDDSVFEEQYFDEVYVPDPSYNISDFIVPLEALTYIGSGDIIVNGAALAFPSSYDYTALGGITVNGGADFLGELSSVASMIEWYKASSTGGMTDTELDPWIEILGTGRNLAATGSTQVWIATGIDGKPAVQFLEGSTPQLSSGTFSTDNFPTIPFCMSTVIETPATTDPQIFDFVLFDDGDTDGIAGVSIDGESEGQDGFFFRRVGQTATLNMDMPALQSPTIVTAIWRGTDQVSEIFFNQVSKETDASDTIMTTIHDEFTMKLPGDTGISSIEVAEVGIYTDPNDRSQVESILARNYSITLP